ncbi:MAG: hypothetical protein QNI96_05050 [Woeseiaceae bacterium]|nr:hypothetical protein [Woeseiaceae bacterium]
MSGPLHYFASLGEPNDLTVTLIVSVSPTFANGEGQGFAPCGNPGETNLVQAIVSGGVGPYTYQWERIGAPATSGPWVPTAQAQDQTAWVAPGQVCTNDVSVTENWRCRVTDSQGNQGTGTVDVTLRWIDLS